MFWESEKSVKRNPRGFLCCRFVWRRVVSISTILKIHYVEHSNLPYPLGLVAYIASWWGCRILSNCLLLLWGGRISENYSLIWVVLHILLDCFNSWEIFIELIEFTVNHVGESYFLLSFIVSSRCILWLLGSMFKRVGFIFIYVLVLSSILLGVFIWCGLNNIYVGGFGRCGSGFGGSLGCSNGVARL